MSDKPRKLNQPRKFRKRIPTYRLRKATGRAVVTLPVDGATSSNWP